MNILGTFKINASYKAAFAFKGLDLVTNVFLSRYAFRCEEEKLRKHRGIFFSFKNYYVGK